MLILLHKNVLQSQNFKNFNFELFWSLFCQLMELNHVRRPPARRRQPASTRQHSAFQLNECMTVKISFSHARYAQTSQTLGGIAAEILSGRLAIRINDG